MNERTEPVACGLLPPPRFVFVLVVIVPHCIKLGFGGVVQPAIESGRKTSPPCQYDLRHLPLSN